MCDGILELNEKRLNDERQKVVWQLTHDGPSNDDSWAWTANANQGASFILFFTSSLHI